MTSGDTARALDWLLVNPYEAAGQQSRFDSRSPADQEALEEELLDYELSLMDSSFGSAPSSWPGTQDEYLRAMEDSTNAYVRCLT